MIIRTGNVTLDTDKIGRLGEQDQTILRLRLLEKAVIELVAAELGVSREQAVQMEKRALRRLSQLS